MLNINLSGICHHGAKFRLDRRGIESCLNLLTGSVCSEYPNERYNDAPNGRDCNTPNGMTSVSQSSALTHGRCWVYFACIDAIEQNGLQRGVAV